MSQFYGTVTGQGKTTATRRGSKNSGITTVAATWDGAIRVHVWQDRDGKQRWTVEMVPWQGQGESHHIAAGTLPIERHPFTTEG